MGLSQDQFTQQLSEMPDNASARLWGQGKGALFHEESGPTTPAPFPRAGRSKRRHDYEKPAVKEAIESGVPQPVDPRKLSSTQPSVTRGGVEHYMGDEYKRTGETFADQSNPGNKFPVVYVRQTEPPEALLLSGHHRATAALLRGEQLDAIVTGGDWGERR